MREEYLECEKKAGAAIDGLVMPQWRRSRDGACREGLNKPAGQHQTELQVERTGEQHAKVRFNQRERI